MTSNVKSRLDVRLKKSKSFSVFVIQPLTNVVRSAEEIPETLMRQMSTCQTAANEFLRQFWTSVYPPPSHVSAPLSEAAKSQRAAKEAKMAGYLASTHEKVAALVRAATFEKVDPKRVETVSVFFG
jgi:transcription initiation factor TFIIH subunit 1